MLTEASGTGTRRAVTLHFKLYNELDGGEARWQETQTVYPDAQGRYTVLLGETTVGGLPPNVFVSGDRYWLGVEASGEREQSRIRLAEVPSSWKADPARSRDSIDKKAVQRNATERYITAILVMMFLAGTVMACGEVRRWWKTRTALYGQSPFIDLLSSLPGGDKPRRAGQVLRFPFSNKFRSNRVRLQQSTLSTDTDKEPPEKAA